MMHDDQKQMTSKVMFCHYSNHFKFYPYYALTLDIWFMGPEMDMDDELYSRNGGQIAVDFHPKIYFQRSSKKLQNT